ncbi:MAG: hypothetical protein NTZ35_03145 [Ignavibacteriales bacterium]|nr:hypothetical protein [Ignavibacteriales bacterium]
MTVLFDEEGRASECTLRDTLLCDALESANSQPYIACALRLVEKHPRLSDNALPSDTVDTSSLKGIHHMVRTRSATLFLVALFMLLPKGFAQEDEPGTKDPALFNRIPGYYISKAEIGEFDAYKFYDGKKTGDR